MKKLLLSCLLASGLAALSGCASDEARTTTTETDESTVTSPQPVTSTTTEQTTVHPATQ